MRRLGRRSSSGLARGARLAALTLAAWTLVAWGAARALVVSGAEVDRADAVVVLGGSAAYRERARHAAELYRQGRAPKIILTDDGERGGWSREERRNPFFVERAARELRDAGVPAERIEIVPGVVASTHEEALRLRDFAAARGLRSLLVVTSPYHSRRALWTLRRAFEGSGVEVSVSPCAGGAGEAAPLTWWLRPGGWGAVGGEYVKLAYYGLRH